MYILINRSLLTIPYKHKDFQTLCDIAVIEFPQDNIYICPENCFRTLNEEFTNNEIFAIYNGIYGHSVNDRYVAIENIQIAAIAAECVAGTRYHAEYQAKGLAVDRVERYRYTPGSYIISMQPTEPNLSTLPAPQKCASVNTFQQKEIPQKEEKQEQNQQLPSWLVGHQVKKT